MFQRHTSRVVLFDKFPRETRIQKPNFLILAVNQIDGLGWRKCAHCVPYDTYNSYFIFLFSFLLGNQTNLMQMFFIIQDPCISSSFFPPTRQTNEIVLFWLLSPLVLVTVFHIRCCRPLVSNGVVHFTPFKVSEILFRPVQASRSMGAHSSFRPTRTDFFVILFRRIRRIPFSMHSGSQVMRFRPLHHCI